MSIRPKVKRVTIVNQQELNTMSVGVHGIAEIRDCCTEDEHGRVNVYYVGRDANGKVLREIINCPVDVELYES